jgi:hypothetical protein
MRRGAWVPGTSLPSGLYKRHGGGPGGIRARRAGPARRRPASRPNPPYAQVPLPPGAMAPQSVTHCSFRVKAAARLWKRLGSSKPQQSAADMCGTSLAERVGGQTAVDRSTCSRLTSRRSPVRAGHRPLPRSLLHESPIARAWRRGRGVRDARGRVGRRPEAQQAPAERDGADREPRQPERHAGNHVAQPVHVE